MMQFSETLTPSHLHQLPPLFPTLPMNKTQLLRARPWPGFPSPKSLNTFGDDNCMEQLLVHCATAIDNNDATLAQQILWVLNNIAPPDGDSNQRLTYAFLRALISRAANCKLLSAVANVHDHLSTANHKFSIIEFATFVELTPWHRFGFTAANAAILESIEGYPAVHIVDLSLTHCMQIPTLIDSIATRLDSPPLLRLTVAAPIEDFPPFLNLSYDELGSKLVNFARSRNIAMEIEIVPSTPSNGFSSVIEHLGMQCRTRVADTEALVINCHMMLHYIPEEETVNHPTASIQPPLFESNVGFAPSARTMFLKAVRGLDPNLVIVVDEDADLTSDSLLNRLRSAYNYFWIPYDTMDTFLPKGSEQRQWYEAQICWKIENVISKEGGQRLERLERKCKWVERMRNASFRGVGFSEDAISEVKNMLDEHAAGWGLKKEDQDLVLSWKGHNVVFATVWLPV